MNASTLALLGWLNVALTAVIAWRRRVRRPRVDEARTRLYEAMAAAARRGTPLAPVVQCAAAESGRRLAEPLSRLATDLEAGASLGAALGSCRALSVPCHVAVAVEDADGGVALAGILEGAARDESGSRVRRRRAHADIAYVRAVIVLTALLGWFAAARISQFAWCVDGAEFRVPALSDIAGTPPGAIATAWFAVSLAVLAATVAPRCFPAFFGARAPVRATWSVLAEVPPFREPARLAGLARFFDAAAAHLRAGKGLADAARAGGTASGVRRVARGAGELATAVERGEPAGAAWAAMPLAASLRARAAAACAHLQAADVLARLAAECRAQLDRWVEVRARFIVPVALLLTGCGAAWLMHTLFALIEAGRRQAMETPSW